MFWNKTPATFKSPFLLGNEGKRISIYDQDVSDWPHWAGDDTPDFRIFTKHRDITYWLEVRGSRFHHSYDVRLMKSIPEAYGPECVYQQYELSRKDAIKESHYIQEYFEDVVMEHWL